MHNHHFHFHPVRAAELSDGRLIVSTGHTMSDNPIYWREAAILRWDAGSWWVGEVTYYSHEAGEYEVGDETQCTTIGDALWAAGVAKESYDGQKLMAEWPEFVKSAAFYLGSRVYRFSSDPPPTPEQLEQANKTYWRAAGAQPRLTS